MNFIIWFQWFVPSSIGSRKSIIVWVTAVHLYQTHFKLSFALSGWINYIDDRITCKCRWCSFHRFHTFVDSCQIHVTQLRTVVAPMASLCLKGEMIFGFLAWVLCISNQKRYCIYQERQGFENLGSVLQNHDFFTIPDHILWQFVCIFERHISTAAYKIMYTVNVAYALKSGNLCSHIRTRFWCI